MNDHATLIAILTFVGPLLIGILTRYAMAGLKKAATKVDDAPAWAQQGIVVVIAFLLTTLSTYFGVDLCGGQECSGVASVTATGLSALLSAILAMVTHNGKKISGVTKAIADEPTVIRSVLERSAARQLGE